MFAAGEGNEALGQEVLVEGWSGTVLRGIEFEKDGVHGTTDLVLASHAEAPQLVIELKLVSSVNSAIQRQVAGTPDLKHLIQSAVYMWLSGLPAVLCYTSRTDFAIQFQAKKLGIKKIEPFYRMFYLSFKDGVLWYRDEHEMSDVKTTVTLAGIKNYYMLLQTMGPAHNLFDRPVADDSDDRKGIEGYDRCNYCALQPACDRWEHDYVTWLDAVANICRGT
jgi:hypothetical protein